MKFEAKIQNSIPYFKIIIFILFPRIHYLVWRTLGAFFINLMLNPEFPDIAQLNQSIALNS